MRRTRSLRISRKYAILSAAAVVATGVAGAAGQTVASASASPSHSLCGLSGPIKHVIYLQFDNTHYTRDAANVPSDLEQMPTLLHFLTGQGTVVTHEHTPLIAHTANDIVTSESGLYGDKQALAISNTYQYYTPDGTTDTAGSFAYWTDPIVDYNTATGAPLGDSSPTVVSPVGGQAPAPWVSYTRAGCDFGSVAAADTELENTTPDVPDVYGSNSAQAKEAEDPTQQAKAAADFEGLSIHCAATSALCSTANGVADNLTDEPGGYFGYQALFGNAAIQPVVSPSGPVRDLYGNVINDGRGNIGFPGYNAMTGQNALAYTLDMQLRGVPVTYTYLTDLHEDWATGNAFGPGASGYVAQAKAEDKAFGVFFADLAAHGITKQNTLFVVTADEGDHFVGGAGSPAGCNGVKVPCTYSNIGEVDANLNGLLATQEGITTPFDVSADSAPAVYVHGQPARTSADVRALEQATAKLTTLDLATGKTVQLTRYLADPVELKLLHMVTGDPGRTPSYVLFGNTDFWINGGDPNCTTPCTVQNSAEAWNHGDVAPEINTTWLGLVGPSVRTAGVDNTTWSEHADIEPTIMALTGLHSDYTPDGRVLAEALTGQSWQNPSLLALGRVYSQLDSSVGQFALDTLTASTQALTSDTPGDAQYTSIENQLIQLGAARDALVQQIRDVLDGQGMKGMNSVQPQPSLVASANNLTKAGEQLLTQVTHLSPS
jgi:hypothetical protein